MEQPKLYIFHTNTRMATRRTSQNQEPINQQDNALDVKEILLSISEKLDNIGESLQQLVTHQHSQQQSKEENNEIYMNAISRIQEDVTRVAKIDENLFQQRETERHHREISATWSKQLKKRSQLYWQNINCENTAVFYETWINRESKIIPKKFLLKYIQGESPEEKTIRQVSILERFQAEINLLKIRAQRHHNNYTTTDEEMNSFLESRYSSENLSSLLDLWKNKTSGGGS